MARIVDSCFFCLPVAGWPLAGASFLFLRAAAATTKVFTSSPTNSPRISQFPGSWWFPSLSGFLYFSRCAHRRSRLFPTDNGRAIVNRTPPSRRHRPGRPLSCRPRALDADCPPQSQSPGLRSQQTAQSVPHAGFNRPSTLCARSQPAGQHSPAPPSISRSACCKVQTAQRRVQSDLRTTSVLACGRPICSRPFCVSPRQRLLRWLSVAPRPSSYPPPRTSTPSPASLSPRHQLWFVCVCSLACAPQDRLGAPWPLESCIQGTCSLGGVSSSPPARGPRSCRPTHHWRWCRTFV